MNLTPPEVQDAIAARVLSLVPLATYAPDGERWLLSDQPLYTEDGPPEGLAFLFDVLLGESAGDGRGSDTVEGVQQSVTVRFLVPLGEAGRRQCIQRAWHAAEHLRAWLLAEGGAWNPDFILSPTMASRSLRIRPTLIRHDFPSEDGSFTMTSTQIQMDIPLLARYDRPTP